MRSRFTLPKTRSHPHPSENAFFELHPHSSSSFTLTLPKMRSSFTLPLYHVSLSIDCLPLFGLPLYLYASLSFFNCPDPVDRSPPFTVHFASQSKMDQSHINSAVSGVATAVMTSVKIIIKKRKRTRIPRQPRLAAESERKFYINSVLSRGDQHCTDQLRMKPLVFYELCDLLSSQNLIQPIKNITIREQVMMFLQVIGHNARFRVIGARFFRSVETVHRYFRIVLSVILKLYKQLIKDPENECPAQIVNNRRFYPYFKDYVGAIDGTHVPASVPPEIQGKFRGKNREITQNVLAAITFDLRFTYVLAGWEGSAHDSRVLIDALSKDFKIPEGKYYLGDAGYGISNGVLTPYRGVRYHLMEYHSNLPQAEKELYNMRHSSLRTSIERTFGLLKARFRVLDSRPFWSYQTQVDVVLASCILHNHIMGVDPEDVIMAEVNNTSVLTTQRSQLSQREEMHGNREWAARRDMIANSMWNDYSVMEN